MQMPQLDVADWLTVTLVALLGFGLGWLAQVQLRLRAQERRRQGDLLGTLSLLVLAKPARWLGLAAGFRVGTLFLPGIAGWSSLLELASEVALLTAVGKVGWDFIGVLGHLVRRSAGRTREPFAELVVNSLRILLAILLSAQALTMFGGALFSTILLGLSLLAVGLAMACRELLYDLMGTLRLVLNRPFQPGDTIRVGDYTGQVEQFRALSTCVRSVCGELIYLPNGFLAGEILRNHERSPFVRCRLHAVIAGEASPERLQAAVQQAREFFANGEGRSMALPSQVAFEGIAQHQARIEVSLWLRPSPEGAVSKELERLSLAWWHLLSEAGWEVCDLTVKRRS